MAIYSFSSKNGKFTCRIENKGQEVKDSPVIQALCEAEKFNFKKVSKNETVMEIKDKSNVKPISK